VQQQPTKIPSRSASSEFLYQESSAERFDDESEFNHPSASVEAAVGTDVSAVTADVGTVEHTAEIRRAISVPPRRLAGKMPSQKPPAPKQPIVMPQEQKANNSATPAITKAHSARTHRRSYTATGLWTAVNSATETFLNTIGEAPDAEEIAGPTAAGRRARSPLTVVEAITAARKPENQPKKEHVRKQRARSITDELIQMSPFRLRADNRSSLVDSRMNASSRDVLSRDAARHLGDTTDGVDFCTYDDNSHVIAGGRGDAGDGSGDGGGDGNRYDDQQGQDDNSAFLALLSEELDLRSTPGLTLTAYPFRYSRN
jgi:hypothetical protein